tara:strand:+ start:10885 stop:11160 length:276 start_codon:yes stop_codon:yes gene_type:complete
MHKRNDLLSLLKSAIALLRQRGERLVKTSDVIRVAEGVFLSNRGMNVQLSRNAGFGRALSRFSDQLGISHMGSVRIRDDAGNRTRSATWAI